MITNDILNLKNWIGFKNSNTLTIITDSMFHIEIFDTHLCNVRICVVDKYMLNIKGEICNSLKCLLSLLSQICPIRRRIRIISSRREYLFFKYVFYTTYSHVVYCPYSVSCPRSFSQTSRLNFFNKGLKSA